MKFSIIVPVYNVQKYLASCIDSVLAQNYSSFEIILVDDGSNDGSSLICDQYASQNDCINVIHKNNGGLSSARNAGINISKGDYIVFLDSDDAIREGALSELVGITENEPDVVITELYNTCNLEENLSNNTTLIENVCLKEKEDYINYVFNQKEHTWAAVQYIVNRVFLLQNGLQFEIGIFHEDIAWTSQLICLANTYAIYNNAWYIRRLEREGSITQVINAKRTKDLITSVIGQLNNPMYNSLDDHSKRVVYSRLVQSVFVSLTFCSEYSEEDRKEIGSLIENNVEYLSMYSKDIKYKLFMYCVKWMGADTALRVMSVLFRHRFK